MPSRLSTVSWRRAAAVVTVAVAALAGCSTLDEHQRRWIFQPSKDAWGGGAAAAGLDEVWIDFRSAVADGPARLHGLWLPAERADAPVLLYLHGARWDVRGSASRIRRMQQLGFSVLAIDYRGFGRSGDDLPSEDTAAEDARAAWDWLAQRHPAARRYVFGHSLGGAIAVRLAAEAGETLDGLILEGTFTSIADVFSSMKWGWLPLGPLITQRFDSGERIGRVRAPVLVVHGGEDRLIPPSLGKALYDRAATLKRWVLVDGGSHHSTNAVGQPQYRAALAELFGIGRERSTAAE